MLRMAKQTKADLETEVMELRQRVEKLEALLSESLSKSKQAAEASPSTVHGEISGEVLLAITAAVAAFLGKRATYSSNSPDGLDSMGHAGAGNSTGFTRNCQGVSIEPGHET